MSVIDLAEARARKRFPEIRLVYSRECPADWRRALKAKRLRDASNYPPCDCGDTEPPDGPPPRSAA